MRCSKLLIGPGGMTLDFGDRLERNRTVTGELSLWITTQFRVVCNKQLVLKMDYPIEENFTLLQPIFEGKLVSRVGIDTDDNSLRLLMDGNCLLSAFPGTASSDLSWIYTDHRRSPW